MGMLLSDHSEYITEDDSVTCSTWMASKFKKAWDLTVAFPPILWILFFLILTVVVNFLEEV